MWGLINCSEFPVNALFPLWDVITPSQYETRLFCFLINGLAVAYECSLIKVWMAGCFPFLPHGWIKAILTVLSHCMHCIFLFLLCRWCRFVESLTIKGIWEGMIGFDWILKSWKATLILLVILSSVHNLYLQCPLKGVCEENMHVFWSLKTSNQREILKERHLNDHHNLVQNSTYLILFRTGLSRNTALMCKQWHHVVTARIAVI